jgi:hypothetical protein
MKLVRVFENRQPTLYAIQFETKNQDEYHLTFEQWNDPEFLFNFFPNLKMI